MRVLVPGKTGQMAGSVRIEGYTANWINILHLSSSQRGYRGAYVVFRAEARPLDTLLHMGVPEFILGTGTSLCSLWCGLYSAQYCVYYGGAVTSLCVLRLYYDSTFYPTFIILVL